MDATLTIRRAVVTDVSALLDLYENLHDDDLRASDDDARHAFETFHQTPGSAILLGFCAERLVASCAVAVVPNLTRSAAPFAVIENVVTHAAFRGRGHASALLAAASDLAWTAGCYKIMLMTGRSDTRVLDVYRGAGFEATKTGFQKRRPEFGPGD